MSQPSTTAATSGLALGSDPQPVVVPVLILMFGVVIASSAVTFIKLSNVNPILLAGYRLVLAALVLSPVFFNLRKRHRGVYGLDHLRRSIAPAILLAAHFITWNLAARWTTAPNGTLIVNLAPIAMPFFLYFFLREVLNRGEIIGTVIALGGLLLLKGGDFAIGKDTWRGDLMAFFSMCLFAAYMTLGRKNRDFPSIWLYVIPLFFISGLVCFAIGLPVVYLTPAEAVTGLGDLWLYPIREYVYILGLTLIPTIIGHSIFNLSLRRLRGQVVTLCNTGQFISASIIAYLVWGQAEAPSPMFFVAAPIVVTGVIVSVRAQMRQQT
ncbi:MAG: DMT family transporter [Opitutales bacterium]